MNTRSLRKLSLIIAGAILAVSCAKTPGSADGEANEGLVAKGLGKLNHFAGQEAGEMYTTQAPHNQVYLFSYDGSDVSQKYVPSINAQANYLKENPGARVLLAGHTDERGSREYNVALGERRADAVAQLMRMSGVSRQQLRIVSYGKERPVNFGHDDASHEQNRRVELTYEATR